MHTCACLHIKTCKCIQTYQDKVDRESTSDPWERERYKKRKNQLTPTKMCLRLDTASFLTCKVTYAVRMCTSTLLGWKQHPLQSLCICSLHLKDTESFISKQNTNGGMQRAPERWRVEKIPHILLRIADRRVWLSWLVTPWDFDNTFTSPPAVAKAKCFLLWMFGNNQSLSDTLSLQLLTCLYMPQAATSRPLPPHYLFPPRFIYPTDCLFTWWWSLWTCSVFIYSLKRFTMAYSSILFCIYFFPHSFNCFLRVRPTLIYPQTLDLGPALTPYSGSVLGMACSEHCGVLRTAWSNVDEARGRPVGGLRPELLSDVSLSAQQFSTFNLQVQKYTVCFPVCSR